MYPYIRIIELSVCVYVHKKPYATSSFLSFKAVRINRHVATYALYIIC